MTRLPATEFCEAYLRSEIADCTERGILRSEVAVARRLLARSLELADAYSEIDRQLRNRRNAVESCMKAILYTTAQWNPEKLAAARQGRKRLDTVNRLIAEKAAELSELLDELSDLHNSSRYHSETHYDICEVIVAASRDNYLFQSYVQDKLETLSGRFDMKYWPTLSDVIGVLATDAGQATSEASDPMTEVGTRASRASQADYFKALFKAMEDNTVSNGGFIPDSFSLSDAAYAAIGSCALDLVGDAIAGSDYVKRLRQRERELSADHSHRAS